MEEHKSKAQKPHYDVEEWQKTDGQQRHDTGEHKALNSKGISQRMLRKLDLWIKILFHYTADSLNFTVTLT